MARGGGVMTLQRKAAPPLILKIIQRSQKVVYIVNLPQKFSTSAKLSCKVQKLTRCHMKIFLKVSKSKYSCSRSSKKFLQIFFSLFIKIDAFKPTSKRFVALWQGTALRIFFFLSFIHLNFTISNITQPTENQQIQKLTAKKLLANH